LPHTKRPYGRLIWLLLFATAVWLVALSDDSSANFGPLGVVGHFLLVSYNEEGVGGPEEEVWIQLRNVADGHLRWQKYFRGPATYYGGAGACRDLLCLPTLGDGVHVLDLHDGTLKARLRKWREPSAWVVVRCKANRILVAEVIGRGWEEWDRHRAVKLIAYDATNFHPVWRRTVPNSDVWEAVAIQSGLAAGTDGGDRAGTFELLLTEPVNYWTDLGPLQRPQHFETLTVRAEDGAVLSRKRAGRPLEADDVPRALSPAVRRWLKGALLWKGHIPRGRTRIMRGDGLLWVGLRESFQQREKRRLEVAQSRIFALREPDATVVWTRDVPGLSDILLDKGRLLVAYNVPGWMAPPRRPTVMALDAKTGRVLWSTVIGIPRLDQMHGSRGPILGMAPGHPDAPGNERDYSNSSSGPS